MKKIFFTIAAMGMMTSAFAQDDMIDFGDFNTVTNITDTLTENMPNDFVKVDTIDYLSDQIQNIFFGVNVGGSFSMGENTRYGNMFDMTRLSAQVSVGKFFYPQFGIRASLQFLNQKGRAEWEMADFEDKWGAYDGNYNFSMACGFVDGLINFHNMFWRYKEDRKFNLIGYLGLGAFYTFNFDKDKLNYLRNPWYTNRIFTKDPALQKELKDKFPNGGLKYDENGLVSVNLSGHAVDESKPTSDGKVYMNTPGHPETFTYKVNGHPYWYFAGHIGLIANYMITEAWDVNIDVSFNGTDDAYNGVRFDRVYDSYVNIMAGVTYHMPDRSGKRRLKYSHYTDQNVVTVLNQQLYDTQDSLQQLLTPVVRMEENVAYNEMLQTVVSFYIDKTFVTDAQKRNVRSVAKFMETHPDLDVVVTGYADVQTAYPKYNMMLSQKRAQAVYDLLVKEYGVDPNRLSMDYKGDEEQPFEIVNEWNRAVVFVIKQHESSFSPDVQNKAKQIKLNGHEAGRLRQTDSKETRSAY